MNKAINLHIANIDLCDIVSENIEGIIELLLEQLDAVSKYKVASDLTVKLDNLSQQCYDEADADAQLVIEMLEDMNWRYSSISSYTEYMDFMGKFLEPEEDDVDVELTDFERKAFKGIYDSRDVAEEFGFKSNQLQGQLHFPNDYASEVALAKGEVSKSPVDEKKNARLQFLANVKAQQNTSQSK